MSAETIEWLNENVLVGFTETEGKAWHANESEASKRNHFTGAVPEERVRDLLGFPIVSEPLAHFAGDRIIEDPTRQAIYRTDSDVMLGVVGESYTVHPYNEVLLDGIQQVLATGEAAVGSAGLLKGGARAWVQVNAPESLIVHGDEILPYVTASTSLDGSSATTFTYGAQRAVCDNTLDLALFYATGTYRLRHTRHSLAAFSPEDVRGALGVLEAVEGAIEESIDRFMHTTVTDAQWAAVTAELVGFDPEAEEGRARSIAENKMAALDDVYRDHVAATPYAGTAYGVVQAANTWFNHNRPLRSMEGVSRYERNMETLIGGGYAKADGAIMAALERHAGLVLA